MTEYLVVGILISLLFAELTGLSPGGVVVPAYFAMYLTDPRRLAATLAIALLCLPVIRLLSEITILYGRRRFAVYLLTGMALKIFFGLLYAGTGLGLPGLPALSIGLVIPGLLAGDMEKQGTVPTLLSLGVAGCLTRLACMLL